MTCNVFGGMLSLTQPANLLVVVIVEMRVMMAMVIMSGKHMHMYRMSECGENLLVDVSEILFNELAFFRLMQNLDTTNAKVKEQLRTFAKVTHLLHVINRTARKWTFCLLSGFIIPWSYSICQTFRAVCAVISSKILWCQTMTVASDCIHTKLLTDACVCLAPFFL